MHGGSHMTIGDGGINQKSSAADVRPMLVDIYLLFPNVPEGRTKSSRYRRIR